MLPETQDPPAVTPQRARHQFRRGEAESPRKSRDVLDAGIAQAAFDAGDVVGIDLGFLSQLFLRQLAHLAAADVLPEGGKDGVTFLHD